MIPVTCCTNCGSLSRGLLSTASARAIGRDDPRSRFPRFRAENLERNLDLLAALEKIGQEHGVSTAQLAFAWVLSRGPDIVPLIGTKRRHRLAEALGELDLRLSADEWRLWRRRYPSPGGGRPLRGFSDGRVGQRKAVTFTPRLRYHCLPLTRFSTGPG
jgi:hypothetical protein